MKEGKIYFIISLFLLVAVVIFAIVQIVFFKKPNAKVQNENTTQQATSDIQIDSPKPNDAISSPLTVSGMVNGNGWSGFEGQVGGVRLLDESGKELAQSLLTATTEWTQLPTSFKTTLTFQSPGSGKKGSLVFHNENASGDLAKDKYVNIPITFK